MSNRNTRIRDNHKRGTVGDFLKANIRGGFVRFIAQYVSQIPIPAIQPTQQGLISEAVNDIRTIMHTNPNADVSDLENEIDQIVYSLYGLTPDEIAIVEEAENV